MFGRVSEHFANLQQVKDVNLASEPEYTVSGYRSCEASILLHLTQNDVCEYFGAFRKPWLVKRCKTCVWGLNAVFRGTEVVKHPFYSIGPKLMFGTVSEHFANLRQATRCKPCVPSLNALIRGTNFWNTSIGPKMMFGSVSKYFTNLRQVKDAKLMFRDWMRCFGVPKLWGIHSTPLGPKWCLGVFRSISLTFDT
jgi:hypothetical protein